MILTRFQQAQRIVGAAYARRFAHPATLHLVESLERENAGLQESIVRKQQFLRVRSGRFVFFRTMSGVLAAVAIALVLYWFFYTAEGACIQQGFHGGQGDARQHKPVGSVVSDACKRDQDPILARLRGPEARLGTDAPPAPRGGRQGP